MNRKLLMLKVEHLVPELIVLNLQGFEKGIFLRKTFGGKLNFEEFYRICICTYHRNEIHSRRSNFNEKNYKKY